MIARCSSQIVRSASVVLAAAVLALALFGCGSGGGETTQVKLGDRTVSVDSFHGIYGEVRSFLTQGPFLPAYVDCTMRGVQRIARKNRSFITVAQLEALEGGPVQVVALAGSACEGPGRKVVDPGAPESEFDLLRAATRASLEKVAKEAGGDAAGEVPCLDRGVENLSRQELARSRNEGRRGLGLLAYRVFKGCAPK